VLQPLLAALPEDDAAVERVRLLGSAAHEGLAEAAFRLEATWPIEVKQRLLEYPLEGDFEIEHGGVSKTVALRGIADRIDLLADGTFRVIDYKLGRAPDRAQALQLPVYAMCAAQRLSASTGTTWTVSEAGYIAFGDRKRPFASILSRGDAPTVLREAQSRLVTVVDGIQRGDFPPRPTDVSLCARCAYFAVCRKDYVEDV
jgi:RecB family exonuclease